MGMTRGRLLVAEDDIELLETLTELLVMRRYEVFSAKNGLEAWTYLREGGQPDLVLLDLVMPLIDGWQLRGDMLRDERLSKIPVVVMSAVAELPGTSALQAARIVTKPFKFSELMQAINEVLDPHGRRASSSHVL